MIYVDESGFYPLPFVARTYAPKGQTPVLRAPVTREHLSVIGGVTADGRLFTHIQEQAFTGETVVVFLRQLLRQIAGTLLVVWDGATIHRSQTVKDFLAVGATKRLQLERLPAYAPDLNPAEGVWNLLKRGNSRTGAAWTWTTCAGSCAWRSGGCNGAASRCAAVSRSVAMFRDACGGQ